MYEQKMCYIDLYRNGVKCGNMGHVRMEWDEERYRFGASLCHMDRQTLVTAMLERTGGRPRTTIQNIAIIHGKGSAQFDWMPLEGNEERLLFQASGQIYGVCVLPKMRAASKQDIEETAEQNKSVFSMVKPEIASQMKEKQSGMQNAVPEAASQREKKQGEVQDIMSGGASQQEEKQSGMPEAASQMKGKQSGTQNAVPGAAPRREKKQGEVQDITPEAAPQREKMQGEVQNIMSGGASQQEEKQSGMLEAVLRTMKKQGEVQNIMPEAASQQGEKQGGLQNAVPEAGARPEKKQSSRPVTATGRETQSVIRERGQHEEAVQERVQEREWNEAVRERAQEREWNEAVRERSQEREGKGAARNTVVLTYPQGEERRRRERHVTNLSDDKWKQLCSIYPTVHPIGDDVEFIKITPADFVILRQEYQNLVRNSFLLHGYYNYEHILLGKYPDKYYIGVPGIMHEQERIAAAMFGFVGFERAEAPKEQKENRDRFGYYMMEVGI